VCFADLIRQKPYNEETKKLIEQFKRAALHCPMNFHYFEPCAELEKNIFKKSFEIMESYHKGDEMHAPGGWQVCCLFNAAKELQTQQAIAAPSQAAAGPSPSKKAKGAQQPSDAQSVCTFFDGFSFADTSEYKNLDTKLSKDCLLVYEWMTAADCAKLLLESWSRLGPKNALDRLHMLIQIS
jgi:hypothetical protein